VVPLLPGLEERVHEDSDGVRLRGAHSPALHHARGGGGVGPDVVEGPKTVSPRASSGQSLSANPLFARSASSTSFSAQRRAPIECRVYVLNRSKATYAMQFV
jgi:hypothetical protein